MSHLTRQQQKAMFAKKGSSHNTHRGIIPTLITLAVVREVIRKRPLIVKKKKKKKNNDKVFEF